MTLRVLVADDQEIVRTGLAMILGAQEGIEVVATAVDGTTTSTEVTVERLPRRTPRQR